MSSVIVKAIVAMDENRVIGMNGSLPWKLPEDLKRFSELTRGHAVLMGRKTYQSLARRFRPLPQRLNIVVTRHPENIDVERDVIVSVDAVRLVEGIKAGKTEITLPTKTLWIIGGSQVYAETMALWDELYLTKVAGEHEGDTYFPKFENNFKLLKEENGTGCVFQHWQRKESPQ